jgi:hypothetical protein
MEFVNEFSVSEKRKNTVPYILSANKAESIRRYELLKSSPGSPRIVFLFTVNQRSYYRHIVRLIKTLYDDHHFYYIHIDEVCQSHVINAYNQS